MSAVNSIETAFPPPPTLPLSPLIPPLLLLPQSSTATFPLFYSVLPASHQAAWSNLSLFSQMDPKFIRNQKHAKKGMKRAEAKKPNHTKQRAPGTDHYAQ